MAECSEAVGVVSETVTEESTDGPPVQQRLLLKLKKPKSDKKVQWDESTVDNEFMGKKVSKCCCIYSKPHIFGESSSSESDSDDDCPHNAYCTGHKKKKSGGHHNHKGHESNNPDNSDQTVGPGSSTEH